MNIELKSSLASKKTFVLLSLFTILSGILGCVFGEIILPITVALLGIIYVFEGEGSRIFSYATSIILIVLNAVTLFLNIGSSPFSLQAIALAFILSFSLKKSYEKSNAALVMTIICGVFTLANYAILAMMISGDHTFEGVLVFYEEIASLLRNSFTEIGEKIYEPMGEMLGVKITAEFLADVFDQQLKMIISYIFIASFAFVGLGIKIFSILFNRLSNDRSAIKEWRFELSAVYAYAYLIIVLLTVFVREPNGIFFIVVNNLYNIFMVMFAYIGLNVVSKLLSRKMHKFLSVLIPIGAVLIFGSMAAQILAVVGVFSTINKNRLLPKED